MSNRRKRAKMFREAPKQDLPWPLSRKIWSDNPPTRYSDATLKWISELAASRTDYPMNVWTCETCGTHVLCVDIHPGVTPMYVPHYRLGKQSCTGTCISAFYDQTKVDAVREELGYPLKADCYWYRPNHQEYLKLKPEAKEHVQKGGLLVRVVV